MLTQNEQQKALNLFNTALVTPTYYVYFTSSTIVTSAILFQGFKGTPTSIITVVMGFLVICSGVVLLQLSKSAKDVPDVAVFKGDLDQVRTVAEQEEPEYEPKADAIRGTAAIIRRMSQSRQKTEVAEARRIQEERMQDQMEPIGENEEVEWDGLRRRRTVLNGPGSLSRKKTKHPPLGMTHFPDEDEQDESRPASTDVHGGNGFRRGFLRSFRRPDRKESLPSRPMSVHTGHPDQEAVPQRPLTEVVVPTKAGEDDTAYHGAQPTDGSMEMDHVYGLPPDLQRPDRPESTGKPIAWAQNIESRHTPGPTPPPHAAKRQFSFQNPFKHKTPTPTSPTRSTFPPVDSSHSNPRPYSPRLGIGSRGSNKEHNFPGLKTATEEERLGLVKGDSTNMLPLPGYMEDDEEEGWGVKGEKSRSKDSGKSSEPLMEEKEDSGSGRSSEEMRMDWERSGRGGKGGGSIMDRGRGDGGRGGRGGAPAFI